VITRKIALDDQGRIASATEAGIKTLKGEPVEVKSSFQYGAGVREGFPLAIWPTDSRLYTGWSKRVDQMTAGGAPRPAMTETVEFDNQGRVQVITSEPYGGARAFHYSDCPSP
jgi:hypothetical protein